MIVRVGSVNPVKVKAVENAFGNYFKGLEVKGIEVDGKVSHQPKTIEEILLGAKNRAKSAFKGCDFAVGIESGIFVFPETRSGYIEATVAVIFDGKEFFVGCSPLFEYPKKVVKAILEEEENVTTAFNKFYGSHPDIGSREGAVGLLTKGVMDREKFTELAVVMALTRVVSGKFFE